MARGKRQEVRSTPVSSKRGLGCYSLKMVYKLKVCMFMVKITSLAVNGYYPLTPILPLVRLDATFY